MAWTLVNALLGLLAISQAAEAAAAGERPGQQQHQHVISSAGSSSLAGTDVRKALKKAEIIPTVIDDFTPGLLLTAKWSSSNHASLGNTLKPKKLQGPPSITLHAQAPSLSSSWTCRLDKKSTNIIITLTDPDAPSRDDPKWSEFCHWIAVLSKKASSIHTSSDDEAACGEEGVVVVESGKADLDEVMEYKPPGPPEKTGKHRYVFLAFVPANGTTEKLYPSKPSDRKHWGYEVDDDSKDKETKGVREWAEENGLVPVAANFIYAENEEQ
ncbi:phosphatidylethanolamine-binding protein [Podospora australis]|uniref:Phosphatidylethanolamine-binding protein n=1 Tax=Podospora australis TaxID=1536484 RepID=A0AAN6WU20_9PEZI|nr:phosphatidylethanolamine-binding protein [Podospora australis]